MWLEDDQISMKNEEKYLQVKKSLNIEEGNDGLFQTTLCIMNINKSYNARDPVVLSRKHRLIEHIVWDAHKRVNTDLRGKL